MTERTRETRDVQEKTLRKERIPLHEQKRNILTVKNRDPNYVYRVVNDDLDRVNQLKLAGYELVSDETIKVGEEGIENANVSLGTVPTISVGSGRKAVLMRQRKEDYEADQNVKQKAIDQTEQMMRRKPTKSTESGQDGIYGEVSISRK